MSRPRSTVLLQHIRKLVPETDALRVTDRELLRRFAEEHDEDAFTTLVRRHGPMVRSLCLRMLHNWHEAEDACQATFLVLCLAISPNGKTLATGGGGNDHQTLILFYPPRRQPGPGAPQVSCQQRQP